MVLPLLVNVTDDSRDSALIHVKRSVTGLPFEISLEVGRYPAGDVSFECLGNLSECHVRRLFVEDVDVVFDATDGIDVNSQFSRCLPYPRPEASFEPLSDQIPTEFRHQYHMDS